ncbi:MAG: glycosyltransferase [Chloroflexi bacterium]|nr:glycosyltransferase [Chloroflexota bacterium]
MTDSQPLVTIITPTYNQADYLPETIDSILNQDYPNLEYIVLDDGSSDHTVEVLKQYEGRIKWESHENMGEARPVNKGWSMAQGEIVASVSSDDPVLPGLVAAAVTVLQADPELRVVYPDWVMIDAQSNPIQTLTTYNYDFIDMLRWHHCFPGPGTFIRKSAFEREGMRDPQYRYVSDFDLWLRLGIHGPFARIPRTLAQYRHHAGSASNAKKGKLMAEEHIRMMDNFFARPDLSPAMLRVRAEAYSAASYIAAVQVMADRGAARNYFLRSILMHPNSYPNGLPRDWSLMLKTMLPDPVYNLGKSMWQRARSNPA